jgi:hypothetical protein
MQMIVCGIGRMHAMLSDNMLLLVQVRFREGHQGRVHQAHGSKHERNRHTHERTRIAESLHNSIRKKGAAARQQGGGNLMFDQDQRTQN